MLVQQPVVYAAVLPHSVWLIPEIGRGRERPAVRTIAAARRIGRELATRAIDTAVVLTPHAAAANRLAVYVAGRPFMDFAEYGDGELTIGRETDGELAHDLTEAGTFAALASERLDRGVAVPLYFVGRGLAAARLLAVAVPDVTAGGDYAALVAAGRAVRDMAARRGRRICVLASGELSHKLFPGAPGGYDARAEGFDAAVCEAIAAGDLGLLAEIDLSLATALHEHATATLAMAAGLLDGLPPVPRDAGSPGSYEAPFGVGYLVATLFAADT